MTDLEIVQEVERREVSPERLQRFKSKLSEPTENGCLLWTASKNNQGYGQFSNGWGKTITAHRFAYQLAKGPIPAGMVVCHSCDNPACCNPDHLWLGTRSENQLDMVAKNRDVNTRKTHCSRGHEFNEKNTLRLKDGRHCRPCNVILGRESRQRKKLAQAKAIMGVTE